MIWGLWNYLILNLNNWFYEKKWWEGILAVIYKIEKSYNKMNLTDKQLDEIGVRRLKAADRIKNIAAFLNN